MNDIPDTTTVAFFRKLLRKGKLIDELFGMFECYLRGHAYKPHGELTVAAALVPDLEQLNSLQENKKIKEYILPDGWYECLKCL